MEVDQNLWDEGREIFKDLQACEIEMVRTKLTGLLDQIEDDSLERIESVVEFFKVFLCGIFFAFPVNGRAKTSSARLVSHCCEKLNEINSIDQLKEVLPRHFDMLVESFCIHEAWQKEVIVKAKLFIEKSFREKISRETMLQQISVSKTWFTKAFKQETGMTFSEYLKRRRIKEARFLLLTTEKSVESIAWLSGLGTGKTMRRTFKQLLGLTPTEYRMKHTPRKH